MSNISKFSFLFSLICIAIFFSQLGCDSTNHSSSATVSIGTLQLEVDFDGKGQNVAVDVPCSADSTVFQILQRAQNMDDLEFASSGAGETAFVSSIDGVSNEGAAGRNWVYRVNGELAKQGCGTYQVKKGDQIEWKFGSYPGEGESQ